ncbi:serine protease SPPA, chloroplastic [Tanacetum coccineum]
MRARWVKEDRLQLLKDVSGAFRHRILTALTGVSGAGKTTLKDNLDGCVSRSKDRFLESTTHTENKVKRRLLLDVIVGKCTAIFQLLPIKDKSLLVSWDTFLVLDLSLHVINGVGTFNFRPYGLSSQVGKGLAVLKLLSSKDKSVQIRWDPFLILNLSFDIINCLGAFNFQCNRLSSQRLNKDLHTTTETQHMILVISGVYLHIETLNCGWGKNVRLKNFEGTYWFSRNQENSLLLMRHYGVKKSAILGVPVKSSQGLYQSAECNLLLLERKKKISRIFINEGVYQIKKLKADGWITEIKYDDEVTSMLKTKLGIAEEKKLQCLSNDTKRSPHRSFPKHETRHVAEHKNVARCARLFASEDTSIKRFEVVIFVIIVPVDYMYR